MNIEYEATFPNIDKDQIRTKLKDVGAKLEKEEFLQKRIAFHTPDRQEKSWLRIRDEGDKITMSYKTVEDNYNIEGQKEACLQVDDLSEAERFLQQLGCTKKAYQESKRELWKIDDVEICIDEWPHLEPFLEIESDSEDKVKKVSDKLELDYTQALFGGVDVLYAHKYNISTDIINNRTKRITFADKNPFINLSK